MAALLDALTASELRRKTNGSSSLEERDILRWTMKEPTEEGEDTSRETRVSTGFLFQGLTYIRLESTIFGESLRGTAFFPVKASPVEVSWDKAYGSPAAEVAYAKEEVISYLESIRHLLTEVKRSFEDEMDRQILFFEVKEHLKKLWEIDLPKNDYFLQAVSLLEDSLIYTKSEDLLEEQVDALLEVVEICGKIELSLNDVRRCGKILRSKGIATLPSLNSPSYEEGTA